MLRTQHLRKRLLHGLQAPARMALLILIITVSQLNVSAQTANISFIPTATTINVGETFDVDVHIDIVSGSVNTTEIHIDFDETALQVVNITKPSSALFSVEIPNNLNAPYTAINTSGHIEYIAGIQAPTPPTTADYDILRITFTTATPPVTGSTPLTFTSTPGHQTRVILTGVPLSGSLTNTSINITNCVAPTASISAGTGLTICNGQPVPLTLSAATGVSPWDITINGTTYNNITVGSTFASIAFPSYSLFPTNPMPASPNNDEGAGAIEVAMKFNSSESGFINGLRFYRPALAGTFTAKLYDASRTTLLATAEFATANAGWQSVSFSSPVPILANTTYVASIHSSNATYAVTDNYFCDGCVGAVTNGPLTALEDDGSFDADQGANGIYVYPAPAIATNLPPVNDWTTYQASNYWIDVSFTSNTNTLHFTDLVDDSGCPNAGAPDLQTLNVTSLDCSTLPVNLLNLSASPSGTKVTVRWTTTFETNNRGFYVERSTDGTNWVSLGFVNGVGNSTMPTDYSYVDINLESRRYFYRLKQVDFDDRYRYSTIVSAVIGSRSEYSLGQNYPNPFNNQTTIQYVLPQKEDVLLTLHDAGGKLVKVLVNGKRDVGTHAINFNSGNLTKGVYYYKIVAGDFINMKKMVLY